MNRLTPAIGAVVIAIVITLGLIALTGCSEPQPACGDSPKSARAAGLHCWQDENGNRYNEVGQ